MDTFRATSHSPPAWRAALVSEIRRSEWQRGTAACRTRFGVHQRACQCAVQVNRVRTQTQQYGRTMMLSGRLPEIPKCQLFLLSYVMVYSMRFIKNTQCAFVSTSCLFSCHTLGLTRVCSRNCSGRARKHKQSKLRHTTVATTLSDMMP